MLAIEYSGIKSLVLGSQKMVISPKRGPAYSKSAKRLAPDDAQTVFEIEPELIIYLFSLHKPRDNVTGFGFCGNITILRR